MRTQQSKRRMLAAQLLAIGAMALSPMMGTTSADDGYAPIMTADEYRSSRQVAAADYEEAEEVETTVELATYGDETGSVDLASCTSECGPVTSTCMPTVKCLPPWWAHRNSGFGEFLFLRPGSTDLIYAVEQTDPNPVNAQPTGPVGIANIDGEAGFRTGFALAASECSSLRVSYAWWNGDTTDTIDAQGANVLNSMVIHPSVATSGAASLQATSTQDISFQLVDVAYRHLWKATNTTAVNWNAGIRYGNIEQQSLTNQTIQVATGLTSVATDIDFDGFGITGGLDFERYSCASGLSIYGKSLVSLLAGDWKADYLQTNQFGGGRIANSIEDFRVTPILDTELGLAWTGFNSHLRIHTGLLMSAWFDAMTTRAYIDGVRTGAIQEIEETMTFVGLTTGFELRY